MLFFHCILTSVVWTMLHVTHWFGSFAQKHCSPIFNASADWWEKGYRIMLELRLWSCQVTWEQWNVLAWEAGQGWPDLVHFIEVENPRKHGQWSEEMVWFTFRWAVIRMIRMLCHSKTEWTRAGIFGIDFSLLTWTGVPWRAFSLDQQYQHHNLLEMYLPRPLEPLGMRARNP